MTDTKPPTFRWTCSYMGCRRYRVTDETGSYEIVERWEASDYEKSIYNHADNDWNDTILAEVGTIRRSYNVTVPIPAATVAAFNIWRQDNHSKQIAGMDAQPERYELAPDDPIRKPPQTVTGAMYEPGMGIVAA